MLIFDNITFKTYVSRTTPEEIERYHKYEVDKTVYGAYKRVDSLLKTYMLHVKDYTEFELNVDVIKIIKDQDDIRLPLNESLRLQEGCDI